MVYLGSTESNMLGLILGRVAREEMMWFDSFFALTMVPKYGTSIL